MIETRRMKFQTVGAALALLTLLASGCTGADGVASDEPAATTATSKKSGSQPAQHAEESDEASVVHIVPDRARELGIEVDIPRLGSARETIERPATVGFDLDRVAKVGPRVEAKVVRVTKDLGDSVKRNEALALMSSVELGLAKAEYLATTARLETDRQAYERERNLYADRISSEAEMLEARARFEKTKADLDAARETLRLYGLSEAEIDAVEPEPEMPLSRFWLRSPLAGVVQRRDVTPGDTVGPRDTPIHVVEASRVWLMIDAFERDAGLLQSGQDVELMVRSLPGRTFAGELDWISLQLGEETRTVRARAVLDNPDRALRSGMFGTARVHVPEAVQVPMVPVDAIQTVEGQKVLFVPTAADNEYEVLPVRLGEEFDGWVEVIEGLRPDQEVVTAGAFHLMSALTAHQRDAAH